MDSGVNQNIKRDVLYCSTEKLELKEMLIYTKGFPNISYFA